MTSIKRNLKKTLIKKKVTKKVPPYIIQVIFRRMEGWSNMYTYLSHKAYKEGANIVVPTSDYFSVAKVMSCVKRSSKNILPAPEGYYKQILGPIPTRTKK